MAYYLAYNDNVVGHFDKCIQVNLASIFPVIQMHSFLIKSSLFSPYSSVTATCAPFVGFILKDLTGSPLCCCGGLRALCVQTGAGPLDDGVNGAAAAGAVSVRLLLRLWDRHRRVRHHSSGDLTQKSKRKTPCHTFFFYFCPLPGRLTCFQRVLES